MWPLGRTKVTVDSLRERSDDILSVFTDTVQQCTYVNQEIKKLADEKQAEADKLLQEVSVLDGISKKNENLANKINQFLTS